jgi:PKD repeat protein
LHTYPGTGTYYPRIFTTNSVYGCSDTAIQKLELDANPVITFTANKTTICKGETIHFAGAAMFPGTFNYYYQIGTVTTAPDPSGTTDYTFNDTGTYTVTLFVLGGANSTCQYSLVKTNYILVSKPYPAFTPAPPIGCKPVTVTFTDNTKFVATTSAASRVWDYLGNGTNTLVSGTTSTYNYTAVGKYDVKLVVTDDKNCKDSIIVPVQIRKPVASFELSDDTVCIHVPIQFTNKSTGATGLFYMWDFGDGDTSMLKNPAHAYQIAGSFPVRLIVADSSGCRDTFSYYYSTHPVVANGPYAAFTQTVPVIACPPLTDSFTSFSTGVNLTYDWNFGEPGAPVSRPNPIHTYFNPGKYIVTLTVKDANGCIDTATDSVRVLGYNGSFSYTPTEICIGGTVFFNANVPNIPQYRWDFNDGTSDTTNTPLTSHVYKVANTYFPTLIYSTGPGCSSPLSTGLIPIRVDKVTPNFTWTVPCAGVPFTLTNSSTALYVSPNKSNWNFGAGATDTGATTTFTFPSGNHPVTLVATNATGCKDSITKNVFVNPLPIVDAGPDQGICPNDSAIFVATGAQTYVWSSVAPFNCLSTNCDSIEVWTAAPTKYVVTGTDGNQCVNKDSAIAFIQIKTETNVGKGGEI